MIQNEESLNSLVSTKIIDTVVKNFSQKNEAQIVL